RPWCWGEQVLHMRARRLRFCPRFRAARSVERWAPESQRTSPPSYRAASCATSPSTVSIVKGDPSVAILGAGKVGTALARGLRVAGRPVRRRAARRGLPKTVVKADLLILALREAELEPQARALAERRLVGRRTAVVHCAGSLGPEPLFALRGVARGVA